MTQNKIYTKTGYCTAWGGQPYARRVSGLTKKERELIRDGHPVYLADCPEYRGETDRVIVAIGSRFYCRMPL